MEVYKCYFNIFSVISIGVLLSSLLSSYLVTVSGDEQTTAQNLEESKQNESEIVKLIKVDSTENSNPDDSAADVSLASSIEDLSPEFTYVPSVAPATASLYLDSIVVSPAISHSIEETISVRNGASNAGDIPKKYIEKKDVRSKIQEVEERVKAEQNQPKLLDDEHSYDVTKTSDFKQESEDKEKIKPIINETKNFTDTTVQNDSTVKTLHGKDKLESLNESVDKEEPFRNNAVNIDKKMLSFTEWKKKIDLVKEEDDIIDVSKLNSNKKKTKKEKKRKIKKNYASLECGAKVVASNEESSNPTAILKEDKDIYMLNPCTVNAWFVVELCERIELDNIDIANFEMFSSTPEMFDVYISSRFPTREWQRIGSYTMKPEKKIQNFIIEEEVYAKFVRIVIKKYFGKEHYCPLSLLRVFGTTEVEQFEDDEEHQDSSHDDQSQNKEQSNDGNKNTESKNIFATAKDAMVDLVSGLSKKLSGSDDVESKSNQSIVTLLNQTDSISNIQFEEIQSVVSTLFNLSLTPGYLFALKFSTFKNLCPSNHFIKKQLKKAKRKKKKSLNIKKLLNETSIPPVPSPNLATPAGDHNLTKSSKKDSISISNSTISSEATNLMKTINSSKDKNTCSTIETTLTNIRQILEPTDLPDYVFEQSSLSITPPLNKETISSVVKSEPPLIEEETSRVIISVTLSGAIEKSSDSHVDVLEFKESQSNVIAQKKEELSQVSVKLLENSTVVNTTTQTKSTVLNSSVHQTNASSTLQESMSIQSSFLHVTSLSEEASQEIESNKIMSTSISIEDSADTVVTPSMSADLKSSLAATESLKSSEELSMSDNDKISISESISISTSKENLQSSTAVFETLPPAADTKIPSSGLSGSKESIILKLNAKVKALQANLTMSMMYLDEMSERYRTAVEEVDKRHERKYSALNNTLLVQQQLLKQQGEVIKNLTMQISELMQEIHALNKTCIANHQMLSDSYMFWFVVQITIIFAFMWACRPKSRQHELYTRSISEPAIRKASNESLKRPIKAARSDTVIVAPQTLRNTTSNGQETVPPKKKRRKRSRISLPNAINNSPLGDSIHGNHETRFSKTAGLLFYAGRGLISGITGAFFWSRNYDKPSRQAEALVDELPANLVNYNRNGGLRRTRSDELATIDEVDTVTVTSQSECSLTDRKIQKKGRSRK